jgi:transposase
VREARRHDPLGGDAFVFLNRRKTMVKLLVYTRGGYTISTMWLEKGTFTFPTRVVAGVSGRPGTDPTNLGQCGRRRTTPIMQLRDVQGL